MTERAFATWVEPIARRDASARRELLAFARSLPEAAWERASPVDGWTCRDVLAHLAGDTGKWFAYILSTVAARRPLDPARVGTGANTDAINARDVEERRARSAGELIAEIEADGEEHQELLPRLADEHEGLRQRDYPMTFGEFLNSPAGDRGGHDRDHLAQLRAAVEKVTL